MGYERVIRVVLSCTAIALALYSLWLNRSLIKLIEQSRAERLHAESLEKQREYARDQGNGSDDIRPPSHG
jgi:hypothetical protein